MHTLEITKGREAQVGALSVSRTLPTRGRRTIGAWCFIDQMGPVHLDPTVSVDVNPHPHCGLSTVTWLFEGEFVHFDSLGTEQKIVPGQLNLMTAGWGVSHAELDPQHTKRSLHGMQLWIAQDEASRNGQSFFEHQQELPEVDVASGHVRVLIGEFEGTVAPTSLGADLVGLEVQLGAGSRGLPLRREFEYGLVVSKGRAFVEGEALAPGTLAYLGSERDEVEITTHETTTLMLLGGRPRDEKLFMWWNFVARSQEEITDAYIAWRTRTGRFGDVAVSKERIEAAPPYWLHG